MRDPDDGAGTRTYSIPDEDDPAAVLAAATAAATAAVASTPTPAAASASTAIGATGERRPDGARPPDRAPLSAFQTCTGCGVRVAVGYRACPKCKTELRTSVRAPTSASGTSISGRAVPWSIVAVAAVATAALVYLARPDGAGDAGASRGRRSAAVRPGDPDAGPPDGDAADGSAQPPLDRTEVLQAVADELKARRVPAVVEAAEEDEALLLIRSSACQSDALAAALTASSGSLGAAGFRQVRCVDRRDETVFERALE